MKEKQPIPRIRMEVRPGQLPAAFVSARKAAGLSAYRLAKLVNATPQEISAYEHGTRVPRDDRMEQMFTACGYDLMLVLVPAKEWAVPAEETPESTEDEYGDEDYRTLVD